MKNLLVSIIVPVFNSDKYLSECLTSLLNQDYTNIEIIVVNDGSTDSSLDIINNFYCMDKRIVIIDQENSGANIARINGLKRASGDYIMFVDSDDYIMPNTISLLVNHIRSNRADIIKFRFLNVKTIDIKNDIFCDKKFLYNQLLTTNNLNNITSEIISKDVVKVSDDVFKVKSSNGEDLLMNLSFFNYASKIEIIEDKLYYYRENCSSTTKTLDINRILSFIPDFDLLYMEKMKYAKLWGIDDENTINIIKYLNIKGTCRQILRILSSDSDEFVIDKINYVINHAMFKKWDYIDIINTYEKNIIFKVLFRNICNNKYNLARFIMRLKSLK